MQEGVKETLIEIVGEKNYTDSLIDMVSYSYDASEHRQRPSCGVWVETAEQVAAIFRLANKENLPVIPRGAGTGLSGMAVPIKGGVVLDLSRMNKILKISIEDRLAVVQPGAVYVDLEKALIPYGFFFPPDPASGKACTLGGNHLLLTADIIHSHLDFEMSFYASYRINCKRCSHLFLSSIRGSLPLCTHFPRS